MVVLCEIEETLYFSITFSAMIIIGSVYIRGVAVDIPLCEQKW